MREWTGVEFNKSQRAVENREKSKKLIVKSSVMPQRPSRLRIGEEVVRGPEFRNQCVKQK